MYYITLSSHSLKKSWPIYTQLMQIESSPTSEYFFTTFNASLNLSFLVQSWEDSILFLTIITIADPFLVPDFKLFSSRLSLISYRGIVLNCIPVDDSISQRKSSIIPTPKYCTKDISFTLSLCRYSKSFIQMTFSSNDLTALIIILE